MSDPAIRPGLVSVTFRPLAPEKIIQLSAAAGLAGIEWGGDMFGATMRSTLTL